MRNKTFSFMSSSDDSSVYRFLLVGLCGALLVASFFLAASLYAGTNGGIAPPQPDTLMYMQYARALAEGHPYCFTADQGPSTGSTSHLYPVVLAIFYVFGAHGQALLVAGFVIGALCYLLILLQTWLIARKVCPSTSTYALLLVMLSGQVASTAFGQTEMPLFTVLTMAILVGILYQRFVFTAIALMLAVWCRPEGMLMAAVLAAVGSVGMRRKGILRILLLIGLWGCMHAMGVLVLNKVLTGEANFYSMIHKGYFAHYPWLGAVIRSTDDVGTLIRELVFGMARNGRQFYTFPLIGGLLVLAGWIYRISAGRKIEPGECWLALVTLLALGQISVSGWQGSLSDRHLGWMMPLWFIYLAVGLGLLKGQPGRIPLRHIVGTIVTVYHGMTLVFFVVEFAGSAQSTAMQADFVRTVHKQLPAQASIGVNNYPGIAYEMPGRPLVHVGGYVSPDFVTREDVITNIELLRHDPSKRFDYWVLARQELGLAYIQPFLGQKLAEQSMFDSREFNLTVYEADWSKLHASPTPASPEALAAVEDLSLIDLIDVGYASDEQRHGYRIHSRIPDSRISPAVVTRSAGGQMITEVGRAALGRESFSVSATPGKSIRVVSRMTESLNVTVHLHASIISPWRVELNPSLTMAVWVDGLEVGRFNVQLESGTKFSEVVFDIPAEAISNDHPEISIAGDHIAFAHWFYQ